MFKLENRLAVTYYYWAPAANAGSGIGLSGKRDSGIADGCAVDLAPHGFCLGGMPAGEPATVASDRHARQPGEKPAETIAEVTASTRRSSRFASATVESDETIAVAARKSRRDATVMGSSGRQRMKRSQPGPFTSLVPGSASGP